LVAEHFIEDTTTNLFAWQSAAVLVIPSILVVYRLRLSRNDLGLSAEKFQRSALAGLCWGLATSAFIVGTFVAARGIGLLPDFERSQLFNPIDLVLYFPHTFVQEFVARGIIQNGYRRFFNDQTGYVSVGFASLIFGVAHIPLGLFAVAKTFFGGIIFRIFFLNYNNLVGVTIFHFFVGGQLFSA